MSAPSEKKHQILLKKTFADPVLFRKAGKEPAASFTAHSFASDIFLHSDAEAVFEGAVSCTAADDSLDFYAFEKDLSKMIRGYPPRKKDMLVRPV